MFLAKNNFYFDLFKDVALFHETCREGFKQCGYLNKEKDILCIDYTEDCQINKIVIKDGNIQPEDCNILIVDLAINIYFSRIKM